MIPHTATPAPMAVTTVLRAVTLLVKNVMIVETKILSPELVLKLGTILAFLLPLFENVYVTFGRHKNTLLHLSFLYATLHISDKMNAGFGYAIPAWGR